MDENTTLYELYKIARSYKNTEFGDRATMELITKAEPLLKTLAASAKYQKLIRSIEDAMQDARLAVIESLDTYTQPLNCDDPDTAYRRFLCDSIQAKYESKKVEERLALSPNYRQTMESCIMLSNNEIKEMQNLLRQHHVDEVDDILVLIEDENPMDVIMAMFY